MKKITLWGTYDNNNYDIRNLTKGLKDLNYEINEINNNVWNENDKSVLSKTALVLKIIKIICCYPALLIKYLKIVKKNQITIISYPGWLDVLLIYLFAKVKKNKIYFFIFISLYDTVVLDRKITSNRIICKLIFLFEQLSYKLCDRIYVDTEAHKKYLHELFLIEGRKIFVSYQGISAEFLKYKKHKKKNQVLYFGKFIPLHGVKELISVINKCPKKINWVFVGEGPDKKYLDKFIEENRNIKIKTIRWLNIDELKKIINESKYILGIFGKTSKANNVIPLKIFMSLKSKGWIITKKTDAINEINFSNLIKINNIDDLPKVLLKSKIQSNLITMNGKLSFKDKAKEFIKNIDKC